MFVILRPKCEASLRITLFSLPAMHKLTFVLSGDGNNMNGPKEFQNTPSFKNILHEIQLTYLPGTRTIEFSQKLFTEFVEFSDKCYVKKFFEPATKMLGQNQYK